MRTIGENLPAAVRGDVEFLGILQENGMLAKFFSEAFGIQSCLQDVARMAGQISHRYPHINVLEIGQ